MKKALPWIGIVLLLLLAAAAFTQRVHRGMQDFEVYRVAGLRAAAGEPLYRAQDEHWQFKYLPAFAFAMVPLAQLPPVAARGVWVLLSVGLIVLLVNRSLALLPGRRTAAAFLVWFTALAMGKFYVREVGLGQSNLLLAVLVLSAVACWRSRRDVAAGALLAAATIVKPYAILFLPYLVARRKWAGVASFAAVLVAALILPAARYGWSGNLGQLHGWWSVVTTSTAPNLAGQDNVSIAGMYAAWLGVGPAAGWLGAATGLALVLACAWAIQRGSRLASPDYLDSALLLFVIPLLSPQGWDYVLLVATPAVMLLIDRNEEFRPLVRGLLAVSLALAGLTFWDVLGREPYRALMMSRAITVGALFQVALVIQLRARGAA
ncbi:MAG: glycosyltransferase family 87 protein [Vicinamibacterales bacterium]